MKKRLFQSLVVLVVFVYFAVGVLLFVFQGRLLFPGTWLPNPAGSELDVTVLLVNDTFVPSGVVFRMFYTKPSAGNDKFDEVVIFFGGNAELEKTLRYRAKTFARYGYRTLAVEYPGYGETPGDPELVSISHVADSAARYARSMARSAAVYAVGSSIGTYSAMRVHAKGYVAKSLLVAPFMSLPEVAGNLYWFYPVKPLMSSKYNFNSEEAVKNMTKSHCKYPTTLIIHGDAETIVPYTFGETVARELGKCCELIKAIGHGHNDIPLTLGGKFGLEIASFLEDKRNLNQ
eukprot:CAMPEP_0201516536 /NCGR_PEP_ID=MMETSP0161_2-20130828/7845_1 /ASSEMBLY_ACC=CAM_ASM_000251 /TAXON_ID=180227 /ORGANISM="Neoparamoeba aestuarina, Strain SoJaBio B1-5/56/2" /LENGTH=288 /DNA_ID=CAMNT_0047913709 /DNA_START=48 /DNA_END=915 /DNA_ORIENTATION=-